MTDKFYQQAEAQRIAEENDYLRKNIEAFARVERENSFLLSRTGNQEKEIARLKVARDFFRAEHESAIDQRNEARKRIIEVVKDQAYVSTELRAAENRIAALEDGKELLRSDLDELEKLRVNAIGSGNEAREQLRIAENKVALLYRERESLKEDNAELEIRISNQRETLTVRDEQIEKLKEQEEKQRSYKEHNYDSWTKAALRWSQERTDLEQKLKEHKEQFYSVAFEGRTNLIDDIVSEVIQQLGEN